MSGQTVFKALFNKQAQHQEISDIMDDDIQAIVLASGEKGVSKALKNFIKNSSKTFNFQIDATELQKLWNVLYEIGNSTEDSKLLLQIFTTVRILSRQKAHMQQLVTNEWLEFIRKTIGLGDEARKLNSNNESSAVEALKGLCNIVFNCLPAANQCCKNGILEKIVERIGNYQDPAYPQEIKFFDMKLLFLISARCPQSRKQLKSDFNAVKHLISILELNLTESNTSNSVHEVTLTDQQVDFICELLKALFNLTLHASDVDECQHLVQILRSYLLIGTNSLDKTWMLRNNVINLLTNMPTTTLDALLVPIEDDSIIPKNLKYDEWNMSAIFEILMVLKAKFNEDISVSSQQEILSPIMYVLLKSATNNRPVRKYLKINVLPPLKDVHNRPEQGSTIRNHLCRLLTSPITQLRYLIAEFLFVLCKMNVTRMIKYTGYGNAAGLLAQRGLLGGRRDEGEANFSSDSGDSETEEYAEYKHGINPVLGCYEEPHPSPMENMTEEQKEYEAMKLVALMDNLTKCGTIKPCRIGADGKPVPIEHVMQLQEGLKQQQIRNSNESDSD